MNCGGEDPRLNVGKDRANRALMELVQRRLVIPTRPGWFSTKHRQATEWRISFQATEQPATNDYRNWKLEEIMEKSVCVLKTGTPGRQNEDTTRTAQSADGPQNRDTTDHATVLKTGTLVHCSHTPADLKTAPAPAERPNAAMAAMTEINLPIAGSRYLEMPDIPDFLRRTLVKQVGEGLARAEAEKA